MDPKLLWEKETKAEKNKPISRISCTLKKTLVSGCVNKQMNGKKP